MAQLTQIAEPENNGERLVLGELRDRLPENWFVISNFSLHHSGRPLECDAVAFGPDGWAYLIETKAWSGQISGNDSQWAIPSLSGEGVLYWNNPVPLTRKKAQILKDFLKTQDPSLGQLYIEPLVVLVSDLPPRLSGRWSVNVDVIGNLVSRVLKDPRDRPMHPPADASDRAVALLTEHATPIAPSKVVGSWRLVDLVDESLLWQVWSAENRFAPASRRMRLKRYRIDTLATGAAAEQQRHRVRRDLEALQRLAGVRGVVPVATVEDVGDWFVVVTEWPDGQSLESLLSDEILDDSDKRDLTLSLVQAVAGVHGADVVHRNLSVETAHYSRAGVVLTDFDYARVPGISGSVTEAAKEELADSIFTAPEVIDGTGVATKAADVYSLGAMILRVFNQGVKDDTAAIEHVPSEWRTALGRAIGRDPRTRQPDAALLLAELSPTSVRIPLSLDMLRANDEIDKRYVVMSDAVGEGGIGRVYKVFDSLMQKAFAAKFVRPEYADQFDAVGEYQKVSDIPPHEGLVLPAHVERMQSIRRDGSEFPASGLFLLSPWIEGDRLDRLIQQRLPPARAVELVLDLSRAAAHLHEHGLIHRDIKPPNVVVDRRTGRPQLVDFNVSSRSEAATNTLTGTPPYRPPEDPLKWNYGADVYAIGVILCELIAGRLLRPSCREWLAAQTFDSSSLTTLLDRSTSPDPATRYRDAQQFATDLEKALPELIVAHITTPAALPEVSKQELQRPNWNPYQFRLLQLFSQSSVSNTKTRGLDEFSRWAYVPTRMDKQLRQEIVEGRHRLVIITGNAGDGKTAFIQMLEGDLLSRGAEVVAKGGNGMTLRHKGIDFNTNWDGSQDEGDARNDDVLSAFFGGFAGDAPQPSKSVSVIAINEGRLIDFFTKNRETFAWLDRQMAKVLVKQETPEADWLLFVNLNLRALTLQPESGPSVIEELLGRMVDARLWQPCDACRVKDHCYARANADALRHPVVGPVMRERIRQTLDIVRLRRRLHITMRDLRSALAYITVGNRTCDEIVGLVDTNDRARLLLGYSYNAMFAASDKLGEEHRQADAAADRLLSRIGELDVAKTADPEGDSELWLSGPSALRPDPEDLHRRDGSLIQEILDRLPPSGAVLFAGPGRSDLDLAMASLRRKLFLEREGPDWAAMLPFRERLAAYIDLLSKSGDMDASDIVKAVSNSEGLFDPEFARGLAVRLVQDGDTAFRSYVIHPEKEFQLQPLDHSILATYVEYSPDSLRLRHRHHSDVWLDIDLDLFEALMRIRDGFTPSREDLRGTWLNLRVFKERLASIPRDSILLSKDDREFYRIAGDVDQQRITATPVTRWR
jgi:serine/threonine protein kinase